MELPATPHRGAETATAARTLLVTLPIPDPLLSINYRKRMHWRTQARHAKAQRHDAMMAAYGAMCLRPETLRGVVFPTGKVRADVTVYRRARQLVPDEGAQWEWIKPYWDGCQDAGVFADDKQVIHGTITYYPTDPDPRVEITFTQEG